MYYTAYNKATGQVIRAIYACSEEIAYQSIRRDDRGVLGLYPGRVDSRRYIFDKTGYPQKI